MKKHSLKVTKRQIMRRKVNRLRREGILPANIYGKKITSLAVEVDRLAFKRVYQEAGEAAIVELLVAGEKRERSVLISNVQYHPVTDRPLHVDFRQVVLTEKVEATIPLKLRGESPAVAQKIGVLLYPIDALRVKALPTDLPEYIEVDISTLSQLDQEIKVKDLATEAKKMEILTNKELVVVKVGPLITKEAQKLAKEEEVTKAAAVVEAKPAQAKEEAKPKEVAKESQPSAGEATKNQ